MIRDHSSWNEVKAVLAELSDLSELERERRLVEVESESATLARELRSFLTLRGELGGFLEDPPVECFAAIGSEAPERVGGFRILSQLGRGGMGVVYRARQESPEREVALKLLRSGLASGEARQRFRHEAEILGRFQHESIARIHASGCDRTPQGEQPWLAMELIKGRRIDRYAQDEALPLDALVNLLIRVCDGVVHAHARGVIHRDLKPANILVDASGQPKVLDFGIARSSRMTKASGSPPTGA